ncbi:hypothetical protein CFC21_038436 [Triticum aestivum]|uniref:Uncharacterized protein n=2 Tax=Triticum aestivum TaxID=4565 RepID=A0A3B6EQQ8_WHEAT|nr:uncharacterized protein LOC123059552 [Triticum aestivum]KAF7026321.1 hypothetical protein CFC21_038436 [Triticum aestivum]
MLTPQKRRRRRRRSPREGPSRRRRGEEGASLSGSLVELDISSTTSSAPPARQSRYHEILASRLAGLHLQAGVAVDSPNLPSDEIVQVLARSNFYDDELRAALVEYQAHKFLSEPHGPDVGGTYFGEDSGDDITAEEFAKYSGQLKTRRPAEIDTKTGLDQEQLDSLLAKYKRYRFKAYLLLLGKPVDELEEAALECKYPMELGLENEFFSPYLHDSAFGWYFDHDLCLLANLSDYQRLVLPNSGGNEYEYDRWSQYKAFYNTPDADREYVLYWEKMVKEMKWLENHVLKDFLEWEPMRRKGLYQSIKIANGFTNIHLGLACHGFEEYVLRTRLNRLFVEGLDRAFLEIWKRVNEGQMCFRDALQDVYNENLVPLRQHTLKAELEWPGGFLQLERQFRRCTEGISKELPDQRVQELIAQEINYKRALPKTYAQYARKKLQVAQVLGIIPRAEIPA